MVFGQGPLLQYVQDMGTAFESHFCLEFPVSQVTFRFLMPWPQDTEHWRIKKGTNKNQKNILFHSLRYSHEFGVLRPTTSKTNNVQSYTHLLPLSPWHSCHFRSSISEQQSFSKLLLCHTSDQ